MATTKFIAQALGKGEQEKTYPLLCTSLACILILSIDPALLDNVFLEFAIEKLRGKRKNTYESSFFRKGIHGDYKNYFKRIDFLLYKFICKDLAREFGYD